MQWNDTNGMYFINAISRGKVMAQCDLVRLSSLAYARTYHFPSCTPVGGQLNSAMPSLSLYCSRSLQQLNLETALLHDEAGEPGTGSGFTHRLSASSRRNMFLPIFVTPCDVQRMCCSFYWYLPMIKSGPTGYPNFTTQDNSFYFIWACSLATLNELGW